MGLKATFYRAGKLLVRPLFGCVARVRVIGGENTNCRGGFLLAANHISHFDPFLISLAVRRKIDWMAMAEFFRLPIVGLALRAVDTFPAERDRADRKTIRTAIERLKTGASWAFFPRAAFVTACSRCSKARHFGQAHRRSRIWLAFRFFRA